jgi:hypothetical protein
MVTRALLDMTSHCCWSSLPMTFFIFILYDMIYHEKHGDIKRRGEMEWMSGGYYL